MRLTRDFHAAGALAGNDVRVVVGPDQGSATLGDDLLGDVLARLGEPVVEDHLGAMAPGVLDLDARRVRRHDNRRRNPANPGGGRHALGMVA